MQSLIAKRYVLRFFHSYARADLSDGVWIMSGNSLIRIISYDMV